ncbi:MAG: DNA-directed RNA polymerase subunit omega [Oscillospiraceae bacterium]|nr:DNA-directed RNA polymerase subunit omega [Oscillospiraceae bacterium]
MQRLAAEDILKNDENYYALVIAVAKRAREIVDDANDNGESVVEKPVSLAIDEFVNSQFKIRPYDIN